MNAAVEQLEMLGKPGVTVPDDYQQQTALKCKSRHHALLKCVEISDLTPKQIYSPLGIEQSQWSRIIAGTAFLNPDLKFQLMDVCGNDVPLRYDAWMRGYELHRIRTGLEEKVVQLESELADKDRVIRYLGEMLRGAR
jgi:plasmid maintenance system antidote protein VapI